VPFVGLGNIPDDAVPPVLRCTPVLRGMLLVVVVVVVFTVVGVDDVLVVVVVEVDELVPTVRTMVVVELPGRVRTVVINSHSHT